MTSRELLKRLCVYALLFGGAWFLLLGALWLLGWRVVAWALGGTAFVAFLRYAWKRAASAEDEHEARERALIEFHNRRERERATRQRGGTA